MIANIVLGLPYWPSKLLLLIASLLLTGRFVRVVKADEGYCVSDGKKRLYIVHFRRAWLYVKGIDARLLALADEYGLPSVINDIAKQKTVFVDCGANIGEIGMYLSSLDREIEYIAIEPSKVALKCLRANLADYGVVHPVALWRDRRSIKLYDAAITADSSLLPGRKALAAESYTVECVPLSDLIRENIASIDILKIEAEGAEPEVIIGAVPVIDRVGRIVVDAGFERGLNEDATLPAVVAELSSNGWKLTKIFKKRLICHFTPLS